MKVDWTVGAVEVRGKVQWQSSSDRPGKGGEGANADIGEGGWGRWLRKVAGEGVVRCDRAGDRARVEQGGGGRGWGGGEEEGGRKGRG
jgi:hypothetical protein